MRHAERRHSQLYTPLLPAIAACQQVDGACARLAACHSSATSSIVLLSPALPLRRVVKDPSCRSADIIRPRPLLHRRCRQLPSAKRTPVDYVQKRSWDRTGEWLLFPPFSSVHAICPRGSDRFLRTPSRLTAVMAQEQIDHILIRPLICTTF